MSTPKNLHFAILPYVSVRTTVQLGPYLLWSNTAENWITHIGSDEFPFTVIYRDREGEHVADQASVLSRADDHAPTYQDWLRAVVVLSTSAWLSDRYGGASDPWLFEAWSMPAGTRDHARVGKFAINGTDVEYDRLYPTPYTHPVSYDETRSEDALKSLAKLLQASSDESRALMVPLIHLFRVRATSPYFSSRFEDIESLWTAFEAFASTPKELPYVDGSRFADIARRFLPRVISSRLPTDPWKRLSKHDHVIEVVRAVLAPLVVDARVNQHVAALLRKLYGLRNSYTHGGTPDTSELRVDAQGTDIVLLGLQLWKSLIEVILFGDNMFTLGSIRHDLENIFLEKELHDQLVEAVRKLRRESLFLKGTIGDKDIVRRVLAALAEARRVDSVSRRYAGMGVLADAKKATALALSKWLESVHKRASDPSQVPSPMRGLDRELTTLVNRYGDKGERIERDFARLLVRRRAHEKDSYGAAARERARLDEDLFFWDLAFLFIRLQELHLGGMLA